MKSPLPPQERSFARRLLGVVALGLIAAVPAGYAQLYSQNFDGSTSGAVPSGWAIATGGGTWQVSTGTDKSYNSIDGVNQAGPSITYYNNASWDTGYTYNADVRLYGSGSGNQVGVVYYYKDTSNYYEVELGGANDGSGHNFHLYEHVGGVVTTVDGNFTSPGGGHYVTVTVVRTGTSTTIKVGGTPILTRTQSALTGGGKIGLVDRWANCFGNNIVVTDTTAPTVAITSPPDNSAQSGTITITASASDNIGVAGVKFYVDGTTQIGAEDIVSPYSVSWDTTTASSALHVLTAVARDAAGNTTTSSPGVFVNVNNSALPSPWTSADIGNVGTAVGSASYNSGTGVFTVAGGGADIWYAADAFQYVSQSVTGDQTIVARVATQQANTSPWAKAGVMFRESSAAGSIYVGLYVTPTNGLLFEWRATTNGSAAQIPPIGGVAAPRYLKLTRNGNTFTASYSSDGTNWSVAGAQSVAMASTVSVGLAVCSHQDGTLNTSTFNQVAVTAGTSADYNPAFPRLGIYAIGGAGAAQAYDSTIWPTLAKFHVVVINGNWEWWANGRSYTREAVVHGIKQASALDTKVFQYINLNEARPDGDSQIWFPTYQAQIEKSGTNWWLYNVGSGGTKTASVFNSTWWLVDMTHAVPPDPTTQYYPYQWGAQFVYDEFIAGNYTPGNAAASLDGFFLDNVFWYPRTSGAIGDWNRDLTPDSNDPTTQRNLRVGEKDFYLKMATLMPNKIQLGNNADWPKASTTDPTAIDPLQNTLQGGTFEGAIGYNWSIETLNGTGTAQAWYKYLMDTVASPKLELVVHSGLTAQGADAYDATNYRAMRYGLAFTLMNDGYYDGERIHSALASDIYWFDEYDNKGAGAGYLGHPVAGAQGAPQTAPIAGTKIWRRDFDNGIVLMIEKGATVPQTINLNPPAGVHYKRLGGGSGWQDPTTNNGATNVTSVTFTSARDGLILLKY